MLPCGIPQVIVCMGDLISPSAVYCFPVSKVAIELSQGKASNTI